VSRERVGGGGGRGGEAPFVSGVLHFVFAPVPVGLAPVVMGLLVVAPVLVAPVLVGVLVGEVEVAARDLGCMRVVHPRRARLVIEVTQVDLLPFDLDFRFQRPSGACQLTPR